MTPATMPDMQGYEDTKSAAARLGVSPQLVRRWCKDGKLECERFGRDWMVKDDSEPNLRWRRSGRPPRGTQKEET